MSSVLGENFQTILTKDSEDSRYVCYLDCLFDMQDQIRAIFESYKEDGVSLSHKLRQKIKEKKSVNDMTDLQKNMLCLGSYLTDDHFSRYFLSKSVHINNSELTKKEISKLSDWRKNKLIEGWSKTPSGKVQNTIKKTLIRKFELRTG